MTYIADRSWPAEPTRLSALERALDPTTQRHLLRVGIGQSTRCLEIGGGSGSVAAFMAQRAREVVVTDLDVAPLQWLRSAYGNVSVREEDVSDELGVSADGALFDLVHARLVLGHVPDRARALANIAAVVRPGGFVLIEEADFVWADVGELPMHPPSVSAACFGVWRAVVEHMHERGYDVRFGRRLASALRDAGFVDVAGEAVIPVGDADLTEAMRLTLARFGEAMVREGKLEAGALAACLEALQSRATTFTASPTFSVWGRR
jgi:SAM-dependent methyltransferase